MAGSETIDLEPVEDDADDVNPDAEIPRALKLMIQAGDVHELRILGVDRRGTVSGYFDDLDAMAAAAVAYDGNADSVYMTLNPVQPDLLARAVNRTKPYAKQTTTDNQITARRWLLVDADPKRPAGISSTDAEHEAALRRAREIADYLTTNLGWPDVVLGDSGNGAHVLARIDLPNHAESTELVSRCLAALAFRFDDERVQVDVKVGNAARISKLYGTMACKGDSTPERPHRRSRLIHVPDPLEIVPREKLEELAALAPKAETKREPHTNGSGKPFDVEHFLAAHRLDVKRRGPWQGGSKWVLAVCPFNPEHARGEAYIVQHASGALAAGCQHNSCTWDWRALRERIEPRTRGAGPSSEADLLGAGGSDPGDGFAPFVPLDEVSVPAFPVEALSGWLGDYVEAEAEATQTPPDLAGLLSLGAIATAVAKKARVQVRDGYSEPLNVFVAVTQPPGSRKSQVFADVSAPISECERDMIAAARPAVAHAHEAIERKKAKLTTLRKLPARKPADESSDFDELKREVEAMNLAAEIQTAEACAPGLPRLLTDDSTPETLAALLERQGGRMAVWSPEGGELFEMMRGRYSGNARPNMGIYLKGHAGDHLSVDRQRGSIHVERPALTIAAAVQPSVIESLRDEKTFRDRGLLARFVYALPASTVGRRDIEPPAMPAAIAETYRKRLRRLLELPAAATEAAIRLGPDAYRAWLDFARELEPRLGEDGELYGMADWAGKLAGLVVRFAGLLHAAEHADKPDPFALPIDRATMERALALGRYALEHARAAFELMAADPRTEGALKIWRFIAKRGLAQVTRRELSQGCKGGRLEKGEDLDAAIGMLCQRGYLRAVAGNRSTQTQTYAVNPEALEHAGGGSGGCSSEITA